MRTPVCIFLGIPGSGKGTQAVRLSEKYNLLHISTGDLLRALRERTDLSKEDAEAVSVMNSGGLVPKELIYRLAFTAMREAFSLGMGCVLDGAVRTVEQAEAYDAFLKEMGKEADTLAMHIHLTDEESIARLLLRKRGDDTEDIIRSRLVSQGNATLIPLLSYYKSSGRLVEVEGVATMDQVESDIAIAYQNFFA